MSALEALAGRCGIEPQFLDARGVLRRTAPETQIRLLEAMGIDAASDAQAEVSLAELTRLEWETALPPVCVVHPTEAVALEVHVPAGTGSLAWRIVLEGGAERRGEADAGSMQLLERRMTDGVARERRRLVLDVDLPTGYHELFVEPGLGSTRLIVSPGRCWLPPEMHAGRRLWGVAAQLYLVRSAGNWGIGDFGDLRRLVEMLGRRGADLVGLNPLHALFLDAPEQASPYSPASRLLLNILNIDVAGLPEFEYCEAARELVDSDSFRHELRHCREAPLVDYSAVAALKIRTLRLVYAAARAKPRSARWRAFEAFRRDLGGVLERGCLFLALRQHFAEEPQHGADWHGWPAAFRNPQSAEVARFAADHAELVTFHAWLQFIADTQLGAAARAAQGMAVGLYRDLAVGADRAGAETWINPAAVVDTATVGAPPDIYNPAGQEWGLPPFDPRALRAEAYRSFIELIRANMRHAGGLRIDHVMGLQQLYWVPGGAGPAAGAYVRYPLRDLVGILALESQRHRCLVVGEDLGTVPEGFRDCMAQANILSYRVLLFERDAAGFIAPERYPEAALAVAGSHDLPTLRAWWESADLLLKQSLHLYPTPQDERRAWVERARDRTDLLAAFRDAGLDHATDMSLDEFVQTAHRFLARTASLIAVVQMDDITDETLPVNVPTTSDEHPNWRRRYSLSLEQIAVQPGFAALTRCIREERAGAMPQVPVLHAPRPRQRPA